ncbi:hypothetical protein GCM10010326_35490 [Streptomyces xanthochromogenes]|uniref:Uncharacterized protein n=1 Tax=Streptomyces xanthochromogenes TaxID=67384 RepID=A0ABQ3AAM8_9ACTN|nr:hypothetical protein GCM10010326_35490 [Streptomyces xanthochromogenes]
MSPAKTRPRPPRAARGDRPGRPGTGPAAVHLAPEEPRRTGGQVRPPRLCAPLDDFSPGDGPVELGQVPLHRLSDPVG